MSRSMLWSALVFTVFAFAALVIFFWIRDGSLRNAGATMDNMLSKTGREIAQTTGDVVHSTSAVIERAGEGDDRN